MLISFVCFTRGAHQTSSFLHHLSVCVCVFPSYIQRASIFNVDVNSLGKEYHYTTVSLEVRRILFELIG